MVYIEGIDNTWINAISCNYPILIYSQVFKSTYQCTPHLEGLISLLMVEQPDWTSNCCSGVLYSWFSPSYNQSKTGTNRYNSFCVLCNINNPFLLTENILTHFVAFLSYLACIRYTQIALGLGNPHMKDMSKRSKG